LSEGCEDSEASAPFPHEHPAGEATAPDLGDVPGPGGAREDPEKEKEQEMPKSPKRSQRRRLDGRSCAILGMHLLIRRKKSILRAAPRKLARKLAYQPLDAI